VGVLQSGFGMPTRRLVSILLLLSACHGSDPPDSPRRMSEQVVLFSDDFSATNDVDLGPAWIIASGAWRSDGIAETGFDGDNQATVADVSCRDCSVEAKVLGFGAPETGVFLRARDIGAGSDRYDALLRGDGSVQLRRFRGGSPVVLGEAMADLPSDEFATLSLEASGAGPVELTVTVNGDTLIELTDADPPAIVNAGRSGLWCSSAGGWFDDFVLTGTSVAGGSDDGGSSTVDGGAVDVGGAGPDCPFGSTPLASGGCGLPDLEIDVAQLASNVATSVQTFAPDDCEVLEGCIGAGTHRLLRFDIRSWNVGAYDLLLGDPTVDPAHFVYQSCHQHYHFQAYARLRLLDLDGNVVVEGRKESFCLADSVPGSGEPKYSCDFMGLSVGWGDVYGAETSCQYLDITDLPEGTYTLEVAINPDGVISESNYANNVGQIPVEL
jgi:hypothetical protein